MTTERFLVTGAMGCIGAWAVHELVREGTPVVAFDRSGDPRIGPGVGAWAARWMRRLACRRPACVVDALLARRVSLPRACPPGR